MRPSLLVRPGIGVLAIITAIVNYLVFPDKQGLLFWVVLLGLGGVAGVVLFVDSVQHIIYKQEKTGEESPEGVNFKPKIDIEIKSVKDNAQVTGLSIGQFYNYPISLRLPRTARLILSGIPIVFILGVNSFGIWDWYGQRVEAKQAESNVIVAVADFFGADPENYQVTENLISKLRAGLEEYDDALVVPLGEMVREQEGSERARELGERAYADLVLWGSYQVADDVLVTLNIENLAGSIYLPLDESYTSHQPIELAEFRSAEYRIQWSDEIGVYIEFLLGLIRFEANDDKGAVEIFTDVIESENTPSDMPGLRSVYFYRGFSHLMLGELERAIADYDEAVRLDPENNLVYSYRGLVYKELGEYENAIADYDEAIRLNPDYAYAYYNRGSAYSDIGEYEKAVEDYSKTLLLDPADDTAYNGRGIAYYEMGEYEQAIDDYSEAIRLDSTNFRAYHNRGLTNNSLGEYDKAIADFSDALKIDPGYDKAYHNRGNAYWYLGNYERAIADYSEALRLNPDFAGTYYARGIAYSEIEEYEKAIEDFSQAELLDPEDAYIYYARGQAFNDLGKYDEALIDLERALSIGLEPEFRNYAQELKNIILNASGQ
jgi:tetratricopeptide (TPR) repeat protein